MGVRFPSQQSNLIANALPASAAETVIAVSPPLNISLDFSVILIFWAWVIVAGTGTTGLQTRIRRGTTTAGAQVQAAAPNFTTVAGNNVVNSYFAFDTPGAVAGQQYALTVVQIGATAAGTLTDVEILAFAL